MIINLINKLEIIENKTSSNCNFKGRFWNDTDEDNYPILKGYKSWNKFNNNLSDVKLNSDDIQDIEEFWDNINNSLKMTIQSLQGLKNYKDLPKTYISKDHLIPFCIDKKIKSLNKTIYEPLSNTLYHHIVKPDIIDENKSKRAYESIKVYKQVSTFSDFS